MTEPALKIAGPDGKRERPDLFRVAMPSKTAQGLFGLAAFEAAHVAGLIPEGWVTGAAVFVTAGAVLLKGCVYRR